MTGSNLRLRRGVTVTLLCASLAVLTVWGRLSPGGEPPPAGGVPAETAGPSPLPRYVAPLARRLAEPPAPMNLLILGVDEGETRTDIVVLAHWEPGANQLSLVSLPRDTLVPIPCPPQATACRSPDKLGHAHAYGSVAGDGPGLASATVEQFLDVRVDHYVRINFTAFQQVVTALGGITLDVEEGMERIGLSPGLQRLDGEQALAYVRFRGDPAGDFGRMRRTQGFLKALMEQALREVPREELPQLALRLAKEVETDIDTARVLSFLRYWAEGGGLPAVRGVALPGRAHWERNLWFWAPDAEGTAAIVQAYIRGPALDGTGAPGGEGKEARPAYSRPGGPVAAP